MIAVADVALPVLAMVFVVPATSGRGGVPAVRLAVFLLVAIAWISSSEISVRRSYSLQSGP
jgi:hypothetical protein